MNTVSISFNLNGDPVVADVPRDWTLLKTLREVFELTGAKEGCGVGDCGACTVIVDGDAVNACLYPIPEIEGKQVLTIEGVAKPDGSLHPIQQAFMFLRQQGAGTLGPVDMKPQIMRLTKFTHFTDGIKQPGGGTAPIGNHSKNAFALIF